MTTALRLTTIALLFSAFNAFQLPVFNGPSLGLKASAAATDQATTARYQDATRQQWGWRGHNIEVLSAGKKGGDPVILVHGFGCSTTYWRRTIDALAKDTDSEIFAIDLLGQGNSDKPSDVYYSINLWAELLDDFVEKFPTSREPAVLAGNSLGSLVALAAAAGDQAKRGGGGSYLSGPGRVKGICMFNCAVGLNVRGIADAPGWTPLQAGLIRFLLFAFDAVLFNNPFVLSTVLDKVVTKDLIRGALTKLYLFDPSAVDDELVDSFFYPAKQAGAAEALRQIYTNDPGLSPMALHAKHPTLDAVPIHLVWGVSDAVTPLDNGDVGVFYSRRAADTTKRVSLDRVDAGHVPMDDNEAASNAAFVRWIRAL